MTVQGRQVAAPGVAPEGRSATTTLVQRASVAYEQIRATRDAVWAREVALLGARIGLAWVFIYHGAGTLFGAFNGPGVHQQALFYANVAHLHPGTLFAVLGGTVECFGGAAVGLGIFGRLAALSLVGDMVIAMITVTFGHGILGDSAGAGYELNIALAALALVIAMLGTGRLSLDVGLRRLIGR
jgi:putative oxidoreductase